MIIWSILWIASFIIPTCCVYIFSKLLSQFYFSFHTFNGGIFRKWHSGSVLILHKYGRDNDSNKQH